MCEASMITTIELKQLPRNALVAFAARCARRVQPLYRLPANAPDRLTHIAAVENAILIAEKCRAEAPRAEGASAAEATRAGSDAASAAEAASADDLGSARAGDAAATAAFAASIAHLVTISCATASAVLEAVRAAVSFADSRVVEKDMSRDLDHLLKASLAECWIDATHVPPEFFGPLWAAGPPKGWPAKG
jgi:hypothetical protein